MGNLRVLVVDDEPNLRQLLAANLEAAGFEVVTADSAAAAVDELRRARFDVAVSDVRMPGEDGIAALPQLRAVQPDLPVLFMTGHDAESMVEDAITAGGYTVLAKPVRVERLIELLERARSRRVVLVVDDEPAFRETLADALTAAGLRTEHVASGEEAIARLAAGEVDLCVLDLVMPGLDGVGTLEQLRQLDPGVHVIATTGQDVADMVRDVIRLGARSFMRKPFGVTALVEAIGLLRTERPRA